MYIMNILLLIYTVSLFIILLPSFIFKSNNHFQNNIICACLFTIIYNITYHLVKGNPKEGLNFELTIDGMSRLESIIDKMFKENDKEEVVFNINNNNVSKLFSR